MRDGELVPKAEAFQREAVKMSDRRSDFPAPYVIGDSIEYKSMITGEMITGRRQHRDHLKAHGCEEVGNERLKPAAPKMPSKGEIGREIKEVIEQLKAGYVAPEDVVGRLDEDGQIIEAPQIEPIKTEIVENGQYIRSDVLPDPKPKIIGA